MPHQCTHCGQIYPDASKELLVGCSCGAKFFYYIRQERLDELKQETQEKIEILEKADKVQIEKDIREMTGLSEELDKPVILDLESIKVIKPGKFEIDLVNLFSKKRPLIYKLEEGKYIIDLSSSLKIDEDEVKRKIINPELVQETIIIEESDDESEDIDEVEEDADKEYEELEEDKEETKIE